MVYQVRIPPHLAAALAQLPPAVKRDAREACRVLSCDPHAGDPLERELRGLRKYRIRSFRVVYRIMAAERMIQILAIGPRHTIYDVVRELIERRKAV